MEFYKLVLRQVFMDYAFRFSFQNGLGVNEALNVLQQTAIYSDDILNILAFLVDHYNRSLPVSVTQILSLVTPQIVHDYSHV